MEMLETIPENANAYLLLKASSIYNKYYVLSTHNFI